jgi:hypothetical protein
MILACALRTPLLHELFVKKSKDTAPSPHLGSATVKQLQSSMIGCFSTLLCPKPFLPSYRIALNPKSLSMMLSEFPLMTSFALAH